MTMVRQRPPQAPQLNFLGRNRQPAPSFDAVPQSPRSLAFRDHSNNDLRRDDQSPMPLLQQQYAYPLVQRTHSHAVSDDSGEEGRDGGQQSEHMLRRKTPNGILNAAYDGTSVEQAERPHAMKHILLPVTQQFVSPLNGSDGLVRELPIRMPSHTWATGYQGRQPPSMSSDINSGNALSNCSWTLAQPHRAQIDSVLDQIPAQGTQYPYQQFGNPYGFMAPAMVPSFGPTASNETGPYGPYWPNGTFVPYRPAALRDMRFYPQYTTAWAGFQTPPNPTAPGALWQSQHQQGLGSPGFFGSPKPFHGTLQSMEVVNAQAVSGPDVSLIHRHSGYSAKNQQSLGPGISGMPPNRGSGFTPLSQHSNGSGCLESGQSAPRTSSRKGSEALSEFGIYSHNAQLRERVLAHAHSVYIDLLKYLHDLRKRHHGRGTNQFVRSSMYPKPPRQPNCDFSNSPSPQKIGGSPTSRHGHSLSQSHLTMKTSYPNTHTLTGLQNGQSMPQNNPQWITRGSHHGKPERQLSWQSQQSQPTPLNHAAYSPDRLRTLRRTSGNPFSPTHFPTRQEGSATSNASAALDALSQLCQESGWQWVDGLLLGGCLAYALADYQKALEWNTIILKIDSNHIEAMSNLAATLFAMHKKDEAEQYWKNAVKLRPSYFEAVEHLVGLLCSDHRGKEAVDVIDYVEKALRCRRESRSSGLIDKQRARSDSSDTSQSVSDVSDKPVFDYDVETGDNLGDTPNLSQMKPREIGSSGYAISDSEVGRLLQLIHAKGNMLYAMGDNVGAAKSFEEAVLLGTGREQWSDIDGLIQHILEVIGKDLDQKAGFRPQNANDPILLLPDEALFTNRLCFSPNGDLPGLRNGPSEGASRKASISTTSNSLLSLAKIFQDGMASNSPRATAFQTKCGVREILALYYLSLSLSPSPSTANNVGILLASVQQTTPPRPVPPNQGPQNNFNGVVPGSGIWLALTYYYYGLSLDQKHAHLYTNLGSLLKDIGQLPQAIKMYEQAVSCDGNFDIALANLANAVKDQGRIADAIEYYRKAVQASPDFAEAVCGLANALNSVCGWQARGGIATHGGKRDPWHVDEKGMLLNATLPGAVSTGWIKRVVDLVDKQLSDGEEWGKGLMDDNFIMQILGALRTIAGGDVNYKEKERSLALNLKKWSGQKWEGARMVRLVERVMKRLTWQWYQDKYVKPKQRHSRAYQRPQLPTSITVPAAPTVLPFHTFTCPMSAKQIRNISQRNGLRISCSALKAPWLPPTVHAPPAPPNPYLKVGYVSSDFNNHPLAHLMQSVFGMHNSKKVKAFCYATTGSDNSSHRQQIEREAPVFYDASNWPADKLVNKIVEDGIHILVNLNGYTRGARNEVFAARPAPIQMSFMGFAGTLGAEWCDYLLADEMAVPRDTLRTWRRNIDIEDQLIDDNCGSSDEEWIYGENIIYCRDTFFCCDHRQSAPDAQGKQLVWEEELQRRWKMRKDIFPNLRDDVIILGNFNQLYKIEPTTFRTWLRILARLPKAILWLLRFPDLGEQYLLETARKWATADVANRIIFTDVAPKHMHISRARVCDLFLDTPECNAHTTAADVLWSGTPLLTLPRYKYKMCSRMAASILKGALPKGPAGEQAAKELIASSEEEYEAFAVGLAKGLKYVRHRPVGKLAELRKLLYEARWNSALFDTRRWVRDLEEAYDIAWKKWVKGEGGDIDL